MINKMMNKRCIVWMAFLWASMGALAQSTARQFEVKVSNDGEATLTCFLPAADKATGRAVVVGPGGAYWALAMQHEGTDWAEYFNAQGIACCVLKYRLPKGDRTKPIGDAMNAMKMVRDSAAAWHVNPHDVGIMGSSAGGHLAATISTQADVAHRPDFSILFYPVISMDGAKGHIGSMNNLLGKARNDAPLRRQYSCERRVRRHATPPAILLLSNDDLSVPPVTNAIAYYSAMRGKGNLCALYVYPTGGHGWGFKQDFKYHNEMLGNLTSWLNQLPSPAPDAIRVACIGNSITDGAGIDMAEARGYPAQLQRLLGNGYLVKNYGFSARTMLNKGDHPYMKEGLWKEALDFNPNIVVVNLGTNDSKGINWKYGEEFKADMQQMIDSLKALPSKPKIYLAYPIVAGCEVNKETDINGEVIEKEIIPIIQKLAKKNKCSIIDMREALDKQELMLKDRVHPNAKGAAAMAKEVAKAIKP